MCQGHWFTHNITPDNTNSIVNAELFQAHLRVAKALKGLKKNESSLNAYITAYKYVEAAMDDKVRIEILSEMTLIYQQMAPKTC